MTCPKIANVEPREDYTLMLNYETGERKLFNVLPYMSGRWYEELYDKSYFKTVRVISEGDGIEWMHGQDIAPHELYELSKEI